MKALLVIISFLVWIAIVGIVGGRYAERGIERGIVVKSIWITLFAPIALVIDLMAHGLKNDMYF